MTARIHKLNEKEVAAAFSQQSAVFDQTYAGNSIIRYKRERVRKVLQQQLHQPGNILEINCGTGEDALWLAQQGHQVHATDISAGMQRVLKEKVINTGLEHLISSELCSYSRLAHLQQQGPYDLIFSNFAGLNCTGELDKVLHSFTPLLKPGGKIILVILPSFCLWETLMLFKGKFKTAFRRFFSSRGVRSRVEGSWFTCWYYNPSLIIKKMKTGYTLLTVEGLCSIVPPSYIEQFAEKYPKVYKLLRKKEDQLKSSWPWRSIGDYYIIALQKKEGKKEN